jgi:hypothetical protein
LGLLLARQSVILYTPQGAEKAPFVPVLGASSGSGHRVPRTMLPDRPEHAKGQGERWLRLKRAIMSFGASRAAFLGISHFGPWLATYA